MPLDNARIKKLARKLGADLVGVASVKSMSSAPSGHRPTDYLPGAKSLISLAVRINYTAVDCLPATRREYVNAGNDASVRLNTAVCGLARKLEEAGFKAIPFFQGSDDHELTFDISLKHAAVAAGLGEFGLNNLFLSSEYGARVLLAAVATDAELKPDPPFSGKLCDLCGACVKVCPMNALRNPKGYDRKTGWTIDKHKCHHYIYGILEPTYGMYSCGMCIKACPVGKAKNRASAKTS